MSTATSHSDIVTRITSHLARSVGAQKYAMWFDPARFRYDDQSRKLRVAVSSQFAADWIDRHFQQDLHNAVQHAVGEAAALHLEVEPDIFQPRTPAPGSSAPGSGGSGAAGSAPFSGTPANVITPGAASGNVAAQQIPAERLGRFAHKLTSTAAGATSATIPPAASAANLSGFTSGGTSGGAWQLRHDLEDFVVGPSNAMAFAAAQRVGDEQVDLGGPLFIHGGCGLGKTHLLQGICKRMLQRKPDAAVLYATGEQFTNAFIAAVRENHLDVFRKRLRSLDLLVVDDVHFIANKDKTQLEFLHSFDQIEMAGARVVLASDCHPKLIKEFSEGLISRCIRGLVVQVNKPDLETRIRLIRALAARKGFSLTEQGGRLIASHCDPSVRELQGMLTKLHALVALTGKPQPGEAVSMALIHQLLDESTDVQPLKPVRFDAVLQTTCRHVGVDPKQVLGPSRHRHLVLARSMAIYIARKLTSLSYPEIADAMDRSNHSTIITACQRMDRQIKANEPLLLPGRPDQVTPTELCEQIRREIVHGA